MAVVAAADMPDLLTLHASAHPGKLAVIDDRPGADVVTWTYAQLEAEANRLANVSPGHARTSPLCSLGWSWANQGWSPSRSGGARTPPGTQHRAYLYAAVGHKA